MNSMIKEYIEDYNTAEEELLKLSNLSYLKRINKKKLILSHAQKKDVAKNDILKVLNKTEIVLSELENITSKSLYSELVLALKKNNLHHIGTNKISKTNFQPNVQSPLKLNNEFKIECDKNIYTISPLSFLYSSIPTKHKILEDITEYIEWINNKKDLSSDYVSLFRASLNSIKNNVDTIDDWNYIYQVLYLETPQKNLLLNSRGQLLKRYFNDPFKNFLALIETSTNNISFEENENFNNIIKEVGRDNIITVAERELIIEKAEYYGINKDKVELYLSHENKNYSSFIILIDEICEDGVITNAERKFIEEKAEQYKLPDETLEKLLTIGLLRAKKFEQLKIDNNFQDIIIIYLIAYTLHLSEKFILSINNFIYNLNEVNEQESIVELLYAFKQNKLEELLNLCNSELGFNLFNTKTSLSELIEKIGLSISEFNFTGKEKTSKQIDSVIINTKKIKINNEEFFIEYRIMPFQPLFSCEFDKKNKLNKILINQSHKAYSEESERIIADIAASFFYTRNSMTSDTVEIFIKKFNQNLELIER